MEAGSKIKFYKMFRILLLYCCLTCAVSAPDTLRQVNILYRHGDRSPTKAYPKNPYPQSIWPQGLGQLNQTGMWQHYWLGKFLRKRYDGFISTDYKRREVNVRSTDMDRTLMSAYSNLAGLFPPAGRQLWNPNIPWQPIPVHTRPTEDDPLLKTDYDCPRYDELQQQTFEMPEIQQHEKKFKDFYIYVSESTGVPHENIRDIWGIYDILFCEQYHGLSLPAWATNQTFFNRTIFSLLEEMQTMDFYYMFNTREKAKLRGGMLVDEMVENMKVNMANDTTDENTYITTHIYSAHDTTVSAYRSAIQIDNDLPPPYATAVMTELHYDKTKQEYFVRVWQRNTTNYNDTDTPPNQLRIKGCELDCPFSEFVKLTSDVVITYNQLQGACGKTSMTKNNMVILISVGVALVVLIAISVCCYCWKRQRDIRYERYQQAETSSA